MRRSRRRSIGLALALVLSTAALVGACGDDDDDDDAGSGSASSAAAPTGDPIKVGFIGIENSPAGSFPEYPEGAQAAVDYINKELGGVNNRPIALDSCPTNATPESSIGCANGFVQTGKVAVISGLDYGADGSVPILERAGIPYLAGLPVQPTELTASNAFSFIGATPGTISALSRFVAEELKAKKVSFLYLDVPAAQVAIEGFAKPVLTKLGVTDVTGVAESPTAADFTPALTKASQGDAEAIIVLFGGESCAKVMQASAILGIDTKRMIYPLTCSSKQQLDAGGAGAQGVVFDSPYLTTDADDPDVKLFLSKMKEYAPDTLVGSSSQSGFASMMNLYAQLKKLDPANITPASVMAAFRATKDEHNFMAYPYTCDGKQAPGVPAICNAHERILKYENGEYTDIHGDWVEGVSLLGS